MLYLISFYQMNILINDLLRIKLKQKQILKMSSSYPANKPQFQTPKKHPNQEYYKSKINRTPPTALNNKMEGQSEDRILQQQSNSDDTARFREVNIRIRQRTNKPYLSTQDRYPHYQSAIKSHASYRASENRQFAYQELLQIIEQYQYQIDILKNYIHQSDLLERNRIVQIFGFDYPCCSPNGNSESKIVLKQLSIKIRSLINENNILKDNIKIGTSPVIKSKQDQLLIKQNQRLCSIIENLKFQIQKYQNSAGVLYKNQNQSKLVSQNQKLKNIIAEFKNSQDTDREIAEQKIKQLNKQNSQIYYLLNDYQQKIINLESQVKSLKMQSNSRLSSHKNLPSIQQLQFSKKQITKQLYQFQQQQLNKDRQKLLSIAKLKQKIDILQRKLNQYQKQRSIKIDSTLRKSFLLTQKILRLKGDTQNQEHQPIYQQESTNKNKKQQGKILNFNKIKTQKRQVFTQTQGQNNRNVSQHIDSYNGKNESQMKFVKQGLMMSQMKNKNLVQENNILKRKLFESEKQTQSKVENNIKLQSIILKLQRQKEEQKNVSSKGSHAQMEQELKQIILVLKSCNTNNFQRFFQQFNQILAQRKVLKNTIQGFRNTNDTVMKHSQTKQQKQYQILLEQKLNELVDQNKRLLTKIGQLQTQVKQYHEQIIKNQIQKLNSIKFNEPIQPSGENAMVWQKQMKNNIQSALVRLYNLQRKLKQQQSNIIVGKSLTYSSSKKMQVSQLRNSQNQKQA